MNENQAQGPGALENYFFLQAIIPGVLAVMAYELSLYIVGLFLGLTYWTRLPVFFLTGLLTVLTVWPLYRILYRIGLIGGNIWKE